MNRYFGLHMLEGEWHALLPRYLLLANRVDGARALDIGCGSGIGASLLLELGAEMVDAIDHRPAVLELARMKHAKQRLDFHVMFWEELDFPDDTFDIVTCLDPSSPVTDPSLLQEVRRVLKPGGEYVCAIERSPIDGLEVLLPRYGYADAAENIDIHEGDGRPPQVGELKSIFPVSNSVVQRPTLSFVFDVDGGSTENGESKRKVDEAGESGLQQSADDGGRWIPVDDSFQKRDAHVAAVELWFCGDEGASPPPLREVRLPYFSLVERLHQVINELQMRQVRTGDENLFDEIVDDASSMDEREEGRERETTNEYRVVELDDQPTEAVVRDDLEDDMPTIRRADAADSDDPRDPLESQLQELSALYHQVRQEFQTVVRDAQTALDERDRYIEHLVGKVEEWQTRFQDESSPELVDPAEDFDGDLDEHTSVFDTHSTKSEAEGSEADDDVEESEPAAEDDSDAELDDPDVTDGDEETNDEETDDEETNDEETNDEETNDEETNDEETNDEEEEAPDSDGDPEPADDSEEE